MDNFGNFTNNLAARAAAALVTLPVSVPTVLSIVVAIVCVLVGTIFTYKFGLLDLLFNKVDRKSKRNGGELVADVLKEHGVEFIFTLSGGHISPILAACEKKGLRIVDTRHEVTCVFAADAVARLSGVVGVACVTYNWLQF